ncbi:CACNA1I [Symbiodinium pilosum]|uniref:CACNA1I protein n=1 Tax=Symbiodinium pilosum TaxID=2952 RepID=A0A812QSM6_SYMPI|nr:CACNA1I [Symbiodinium pilosum]
MSIAGGVSWEQVLVPLKAIALPWVLLFLFYMFFTYFAVLNVITGVFCQTAIDSAQNDHATVIHSILANKQAHLEKVRDLFNKLGAENTGGITYLMFEEKITSPEVKEYFESLGLDVWDAWSFFKMLDLDDSGAVDIEEFLMGCLRVRGNAKAIDIGKIIHDQTWQIKEQGKFQTYVESWRSGLSDFLGFRFYRI